MKLQRSTLILLASALLLGGVVLITEVRQVNRPTDTQGESTSPVYAFEEASVVGLRIETTGQAVAFERDAAGFWQMTEPEDHPAEAAAIAFLLSRLTTDGLLQTTTIDAADQAEFGLEVPFATVEITLEDGTEHTLVLGDADFSGQNAYALIDPETVPLSEEAGEVSVALVSQDVLNGVERPLEEWKATVDAPADTEAGTEGDTSEETETSPVEDTPSPTEETPAEAGADPSAEEAPEADAPEDLPTPETEPIPVPAPDNSDSSQ